MSKFYQTFQSPYGLCKPPQTIFFTLPSSVSARFWSKISENIFFRRNSSLTKTTDSCSFLIKRYLIVVNLSHIILSANHSIVYICCWRRNQQARNKLFDENFIATPQQVTENFVFPCAFCLFFVFFISVFWPIETNTANLQGLTHSNPSRNTNQGTLSNEHMNHLFWV